VASLRDTLPRLDEKTRAKVWAAIETLAMDGGMESSPLQTGIREYKQRSAAILPQAMYAELVRTSGDLEGTFSLIIMDCISDLADMALVCCDKRKKHAAEGESSALDTVSPHITFSGVKHYIICNPASLHIITVQNNYTFM
jgi:hypothetical protein